MIFVDTGFFLALAQPRDALHLRAQLGLEFWSNRCWSPSMCCGKR